MADVDNVAADAAVQAIVDEGGSYGPDGELVKDEAPAAEAAAAEEKPAEETAKPEPEAAEAPKEDRMVPLSVVQEMREELKAARIRAERSDALLSEYHSRAEEIRARHSAQDSEAAAQAAAAAEQAEVEKALGAMPDPIENPLEAAQWENEKRLFLMQRRHDKEIGELKDLIKGKQTQESEGQVEARVRSMSQDYAKTNPEYQGALKHVIEVETRAAIRQGYREGTKQLADYLEGRAKNLVMNALNEGKNPAEAIWETAQDYGFKPTAKPAEAAPTPKAADPTEKRIAAKAEGQAVRSMPSGGAVADNKLPTLEELNTMPHDQYRKWYSNPKNAAYADELLRNA